MPEPTTWLRRHSWSRLSAHKLHDDVANARPWLFGIATNLMRNQARSERRLPATATVQSIQRKNFAGSAQTPNVSGPARAKLGRVALIALPPQASSLVRCKSHIRLYTTGTLNP